jgi:hypothetical protein
LQQNLLLFKLLKSNIQDRPLFTYHFIDTLQVIRLGTQMLQTFFYLNVQIFKTGDLI